MAESYTCAKCLKLGSAWKITGWTDDLCHFFLLFYMMMTMFQRLPLGQWVIFLAEKYKTIGLRSC